MLLHDFEGVDSLARAVALPTGPPVIPRVRCSKTRRLCASLTKAWLPSPGVNLGGFGWLRIGGKGMFEIMGQARVFPTIYPNSAKTASGWPTGQN